MAGADPGFDGFRSRPLVNHVPENEIVGIRVRDWLAGGAANAFHGLRWEAKRHTALDRTA